MLGSLKHAFSESDLPFRVDVVDWAATEAGFRKIIEAECVVFRLRRRSFEGEVLGAISPLNYRDLF